jgi:hypothetical protein
MAAGKRVTGARLAALVAAGAGRVMNRVPLRDLARPTRTKLVVLLILFVGSVVAEREGYLVFGMPGEAPIAVVILALFLRAVRLRMTIAIPPSEGPFTHQNPRE